MRRLLPLLSLLFTLLLAVPALAHASLLTSEPTDGSVVATAPSTFTLTFNEPVSPTVLSLIEPGGQAVPLDHPHLADDVVSVPMPPALADGSYALSWRVISADGHPIGGSVVFSIGAPSTANQPQVAPTFDPVVRAGIWLSKLLVYGGLFVGIGGVFARRWLGIAKAGRATEFALLAGTLGLLPNVGFEGADALGRPANALLDLAAWSEGLVGSHGIFVGLALLALLLAFVASRTGAVGGRIVSLLALVALGTAFASTGHAGTADPQWLTRPAVFLHTVTVAFWIGALAPLAAVLRAGAGEARAPLQGFSAAIPWTTGVLLASGVALAIVQLAAPAELLTTDYGRVLVGKLVLVAVLFGIAAYNRWRLTRPVLAGDAPMARRLGRITRLELALAVAILGIVGVWRFTPPPRSLLAADAAPATVEMVAPGGMADVTLSPGRAGAMSVTIDVMLDSGNPPKQVTVDFANAARGIEPIEKTATQDADGLWHVEGLVLPAAGEWQIGVEALVSDFEILQLNNSMELR